MLGPSFDVIPARAGLTEADPLPRSSIVTRNKQPSHDRKRFNWPRNSSRKGKARRASPVTRESGAPRSMQVNPLASAYRLPPGLAPPRPGIRVSSLAAPDPSRAGSLQRSLSSPASLRSRSLRDDQDAVHDPSGSPECIIESSRTRFGTYLGAPFEESSENLTFFSDIDESYEMRRIHSSTSTTSGFVSCEDEQYHISEGVQTDAEEASVIAEGIVLPMIGVGFDDLQSVRTAHTSAYLPCVEGEEEESVSLVLFFENFLSADAHLRRAVDRLSVQQSSLLSASARRMRARRSTSLPSLPTVDLSQSATSISSVRARWHAISSMMRPQPDLPDRQHQDDGASSGQESDSSRLDRRLLVRLAVDDVRHAQARLLARLTDLMDNIGIIQTQVFDQSLLVSAQNLLANATFDIDSEEVRNLRTLAMRMCENLERVRDLSNALRAPHSSLPRSRSLRVSASKAQPVAPIRDSSLQSITRRFVHLETLTVALSAWNAAYRNFASAWRLHQVSARQARRLARENLRTSRLLTAATAADATVANTYNFRAVAATAQLVSQTLLRALDSGLIARQDAINLEPRVFFALPRLSILYGARDAFLPPSWEIPSIAFSEKAPERPLALFLPRVCGSLSNYVVHAIRDLPNDELGCLAQQLAGTVSGRTSRRMSAAKKEELFQIYREIAAHADRASIANKSWNRTLSRCLKAWATKQQSEDGHA